MRTPLALLAASSVAIALAACGGDDGGPSGVPGPDGIDAPDPPADIDDIGDIGDIGDAQDMVEEMTDDLDEMASGMGGDGGGEISIGDVTYGFEADMCLSQQGDLTMDGPVTGSDGSTGWANVSLSVITREAMAEAVGDDERALDAIFPDGVDATEEMTLSVDIGRTGRMDSGGDDDPRWFANASTTRDGSVDYETFDGGVRGSGEIFSGELGTDVAPLEFEVACN
jgi:hypothetical protein